MRRAARNRSERTETPSKNDGKEKKKERKEEPKNPRKKKFPLYVVDPRSAYHDLVQIPDHYYSTALRGGIAASMA